MKEKNIYETYRIMCLFDVYFYKQKVDWAIVV